MRMRSRSSQVTGTYSWRDLRWDGTCAEPWRVINDSIHTGSYVTTLETETFRDVVTPHYHALSSKGFIVNNPMEQIKTVKQTPACSLDQHQVIYNLSCTPQKQLYSGWHQTGTTAARDLLSQQVSAPDPGRQSVRDQALTTAFSKTAGNNAMIGVTAGEFRETVSSFRDLLRRAVRIAFALKRFDLKVLAKEISPKEIANRYMEARYAFRPLYYEARQIIDALDCSSKSKRWTCRGWANASETVSETVDWVLNSAMTVRINRSCTVEVAARAGVLTDIADYSSLHNWGVLQPLSTVWELIPLSFVVDWFCNVGKVIATYEPLIGARHLASWVVITTTTTHTVSLVGAIPTWPDTRVAAKSASWSGTHSSVCVHKERIPNPQVPTLPRFTVSLDVWKILDLGLILKSTWKSLLKP